MDGEMDTANIECLMKHSGATSNPSVPPNSWQWRPEPSAVLPLRYSRSSSIWNLISC